MSNRWLSLTLHKAINMPSLAPPACRTKHSLPQTAVCLCLLSAFAMVGPAAAQAQDRPNIVFILADDLGYGDLGCYGQTRIQTPRIDQLALSGMRFTQCYAGSTVCAPSRSTLMTGQHTGHTRVRANGGGPLRPGDITLAEILHDAGYRTGLVGKWGLGEADTTGIPNRQGFDFFYGYLNQGHAHNYWPDFLWRNEMKEALDGNVIGPHDGVSIEQAQYSNDRITDEALRFLRDEPGRPFFLYLALTLPHANNERGRSDGNGMEIPPDRSSSLLYADTDWPQPQKNHAAMITELDTTVGRVLDALDELHLRSNTVVFFTSDNGPHKEGGADPAFFQSSGVLRGYKRALHEGGIRVPGIVSWPGRVAAGETSDQIWAFWDVMPTTAELAGGLSVPSALDGVSIAPVLLGESSHVEHPPLYWEFHEGGFSQAVRFGAWKAVRLKGPDRPIELYHLAEDLGEQQDLAAQKPEIVRQATALMSALRVDSDEYPVKPAPAARVTRAKP